MRQENSNSKNYFNEPYYILSASQIHSILQEYIYLTADELGQLEKLLKKINKIAERKSNEFFKSYEQESIFRAIENIIERKPLSSLQEDNSLQKIANLDEISYQDDLQSIIKYISNPREIMVELRMLNTALTELAKKRGMYDERTGKLKTSNAGGRFKDRKLLSGFLHEWAKGNGFASPVKPVKIETQLDDKAFLATIREGHLFKDAAFRGDFHGEWTHYIHWFCIVLRYQRLQRENTKGISNVRFLNHSPRDIYRWLGHQPGNTWLYSLEIFGSTTGVHKFIHIQDFYAFLLSEEAATELSVLQQILAGRAQKVPPTYAAQVIPRNYRSEKTPVSSNNSNYYSFNERYSLAKERIQEKLLIRPRF